MGETLRSLHKKWSGKWLLLLVVMSGVLVLIPSVKAQTADLPTKPTAPLMPMTENNIQVPYADVFGYTGLYICRPPETFRNNSYWGSVEKELGNDIVNFYPEYQALIKVHDVWQDMTGDAFTVEVSRDRRSVIWTLQETAPAAIYGIACRYEYDGERYEQIFQIVYTDSWTYVAVTNEENQTYLHDYYGGTYRRLSLKIDYNPGATISVLNSGAELANKVRYGRIDNAQIVAVENMTVSLSTVSGEVYPAEKIYSEVTGNVMTLMFDEDLGNDTYILKIYSDYDDHVFGQFIINNQAAPKKINLSTAWVLVMILGAILSLGGAGAFFAPLLMIKINQYRVHKENIRIAQAKNPEAFANNNGGFLQKFKKNLQKIGKKLNKEEIKEEDKPKLEETSHKVTNRLTEMIREKQENRKFSADTNMTSEQIAALKKEQEIKANIQKHSFASLRSDDDDEIASLRQEEEEAATIETGSYVKDGVTFAKLDSVNDTPAGENDH